MEWVAEPFDAGQSLPGMWEAAALGGASKAWVASAWIRRDGLSRVEAPLRMIAARGLVRFLVGRSFGETTADAVALACEVSADVRLFHDPGGRTFHPKVYLACSEETAWLLVGSQNLTGGGVDDNFEASVYLRCPVTEPIVGQVMDWFDRLAAPGRSVPVTLETLAEMDLRSERERNEQRRAQRAAAGAHGGGGGGLWQALFSAPPMPGLRPVGGMAGAAATPGGRAGGAGRSAGSRAVHVLEGAPDRLSRDCPPPTKEVSRDPATARLWEQVHARLMLLAPDIGWHYTSGDKQRRTYYFPSPTGDGRLWFLLGDRGHVSVNVYRKRAWVDIAADEGVLKTQEGSAPYRPVRITTEDVDDRMRVLERVYQRLRFDG